jgi:hypothetical protein
MVPSACVLIKLRIKFVSGYLTLERPFLIFGANTALAGSTVGVITSPEEMSLNIDDDANDDAGSEDESSRNLALRLRGIAVNDDDDDDDDNDDDDDFKVLLSLLFP